MDLPCGPQKSPGKVLCEVGVGERRDSFPGLFCLLERSLWWLRRKYKTGDKSGLKAMSSRRAELAAWTDAADVQVERIGWNFIFFF